MKDNYPESVGGLSIPKRNRHIRAIIAFIESYLDDFIVIYFDQYSNITNETGITQELCSFFQSKINEHPFYFHHEDRTIPGSGKSPSVDFSVKTREPFGEFKNRQTVFCLEAKRLPTLGFRREKEYVIGHLDSNGRYKSCGGVERFKKQIHGNELSHSAIIGYVQKYDFKYWFIKINAWVDELICSKDQEIEWRREDKLQKVDFAESTAKLISTSKRKSDQIILYHYWINLSNVNEA